MPGRSGLVKLCVFRRAAGGDGIGGQRLRLARDPGSAGPVGHRDRTGETFAPPPAWAKPKLDGVQAWDESFLGQGKGSPRRIPADVSYQPGLLTVPPSVTDVLAWGVRFPARPVPAAARLTESDRCCRVLPLPSAAWPGDGLGHDREHCGPGTPVKGSLIAYDH